ncbi:RNA-guided endonuclease InsQ/TnpB family protein, partial [Geminocystis sp. CENA526]|uniref:RNA-guided endonuclease InsQ/TnpB family protein n=1 Tax=Geminocystis sp. CENA526 TaxID=1355871 RepID=UPI003D6F5D10
YNKVRKQHYKVACQRQDFLQQTTTKLCKTYGHIKIESLNVQGMMANHKLASSIADLGMYEFKRQLTYKAQWYANRIDLIDQWYPSSKKCSNCGHKKETLSLSERLYVCDECGLSIDRDLNASINLEKAPEEVIREKIGWVTAELTSVDSIKPT